MLTWSWASIYLLFCVVHCGVGVVMTMTMMTMTIMTMIKNTLPKNFFEGQHINSFLKKIKIGFSNRLSFRMVLLWVYMYVKPTNPLFHLSMISVLVNTIAMKSALYPMQGSLLYDFFFLPVNPFVNFCWKAVCKYAWLMDLHPLICTANWCNLRNERIREHLQGGRDDVAVGCPGVTLVMFYGFSSLHSHWSISAEPRQTCSSSKVGPTPQRHPTW